MPLNFATQPGVVRTVKNITSADTFSSSKTVILNVSEMKQTTFTFILKILSINFSLVLSQSGNHFKICPFFH